MDNKPLVDLVNINTDTNTNNVPDIPSDFPSSNKSNPSVVNNQNKVVKTAPGNSKVPKKKVKKHKFKYTFRKIPMLLPTKIFLGIMGGLFLLCIIAVILGIFIPSVSEFMWFNLRNPYFDLGFKLFNNVSVVFD